MSKLLRDPAVDDVTACLSRASLDGPGDVSLNDLVILKTLGTGTFGRVYLVWHAPTRSYYALKVLKKTEIVKLKQVEHTNNERAILKSVKHPFIVNIYKTFQNERTVVMLLDYAPGGELFTHLRRAGKFPETTARFFASEILLALDYLHQQRIVYRDLKPENLLLDADGHIKITDFGFAKIVDERTFTLCGTPEYLAPEIIQSKGHNKAVDWWAFGILIFEMIVGYPPFYDDNAYGIYEKILTGTIVFPGHVTPEAKELIRKLLTADRSRRLGALKGGIDDIKNHKWFKTVDWTAVYQCRVPSPMSITLRNPGDTSNFEAYEEVDPWDTSDPVDPAVQNMFPDF